MRSVNCHKEVLSMKKQLLVGLLVGFAVGATVSPLNAAHTLAELILGDGTFPALRTWDFQDLVTDASLYVGTTAGPVTSTPSFFYTRVPPSVHVAQAPIGAAIRSEGFGDAVGMYLYSENEGNGIAFGANSIAATYSGAPAVGLEVNGVNRSGNPNALVRGIDIVNSGTAQTQWALGIETSVSHPAGKPKVGIMLAGINNAHPYAPASQTGIVIDHIDSGEAIRIVANNRIAFNHLGTIFMKYNPNTNAIEFYNGAQLKFAIPM
jgi:hypothetical protein